MIINKTLLQNAEPKNGNVLWAQPVGDKLQLKAYNKGKWSDVAGGSSSSSNDNQNTYRYCFQYEDYIYDTATGEHIPLWKAHKLTATLLIPSGRDGINYPLYLISFADVSDEEDANDMTWWSTWAYVDGDGNINTVTFPRQLASTPVIS